MTAIEVYHAVVCRGGHIIPRGDTVVVKASAGVDLADLKAELRWLRGLAGAVKKSAVA